MTRLRVGVCESRPELEPETEEWEALCRRLRGTGLDLFLMSEMPFGGWISAGESFDADSWRRSCELHARGLAALGELGAPVVLGTRPLELGGRRVNEGFVWAEGSALDGVHTKLYFPDEEGYYEARWFEPGPTHFEVCQAGPLRVGFLICTEVMFNEHARHYGRAGADVIVVPRAVGRESLPRWRVAVRMAAVVSGCYVLSSNRSGVDRQGQRFGGCGWIVDPLGEVVAETSPATPVVSWEADTELVRRAQGEYPCYVPELPG